MHLKEKDMAQHAMQDGSISSREATRKAIMQEIEKQMDKLPSLSESCCIYRVPKLLRGVNPEEYTPILVPIGPLHQEDYGQKSSSVDCPDLFSNGVYKFKCLKSFLNQPQVELKDCLDVVSLKSAKIRACYAHCIKIFEDDEVFTKMVLLDSVFIIQFLRDHTRPRDQRDSMWMSLKAKEIARDIMLAENQLPLFILEELCQCAYQESFMDIAFHFFEIKREKFAFIRESPPCHLLDMMRISLLPYTKEVGSDIFPKFRRLHVDDVAMRKSRNGGFNINRQDITCPSAAHLYEAGIKFKVKTNALSLLDISFDQCDRVLYIPNLKVDDETECLLRNLIAFEKSRSKEDENYITDYIFFIDCLITTPTDMQVLTKAGIIENWLGSEKNLSEMINSMGKHAYDFSKGYLYTGLAQQLNTYYKRKWNRYMAILNQVYFSHPWAGVPVGYAIVLLVLTIIQATGSIIDIVGSIKGTKDKK